jgi:hypothetical protein
MKHEPIDLSRSTAANETVSKKRDYRTPVLNQIDPGSDDWLRLQPVIELLQRDALRRNQNL